MIRLPAVTQDGDSTETTEQPTSTVQAQAERVNQVIPVVTKACWKRKLTKGKMQADDWITTELLEAMGDTRTGHQRRHLQLHLEDPGILLRR